MIDGHGTDGMETNSLPRSMPAIRREFGVVGAHGIEAKAFVGGEAGSVFLRGLEGIRSSAWLPAG